MRKPDGSVSKRILAALSEDAANPSRLMTVAAAVGMPLRLVGAMLTYLVRKGHAVRVKPGHYVRVAE